MSDTKIEFTSIMSTNPFTEWPFWHYYSLHLQNASFIDDNVRRISPGDQPVPLSSLRTNTQLYNAIEKSYYYDFINDAIVRGSDLDQSKIWVVTPLSFTKTSESRLPSDALVVVKGVMRDNKGGDVMSLIATPSNMRYIFNALGPAQSIARGITSDDKGNPIKRYDIMAVLPSQTREKIEQLLNRPIYQSWTIQTILQSYKRQSSVSSDIERNATRIGQKLMKVIPEEKAINVTSGSLVNATAPCYSIEELQVIPPNSNDYRVVKFAFKTNLKDDDRQIYMNLLRERFKARKEEASSTSIEQRRAISLEPIRASLRDYNNLFNSNEGFQAYIQKVNEITTLQNIDTSQILHGEVGDEDEDEIYDDDAGEFDLDNY